jgi:predicted pyridoxine 5'-phosphate oxidase superfamily flavin-nucleotide-binding protein
VIDVKPFAADAKAKIAAALAEFQKNEQGVRVDAAVNDVRLTGIAFDGSTLRIIAEADGTARATVTRLPSM